MSTHEYGFLKGSFGIPLIHGKIRKLIFSGWLQTAGAKVLSLDFMLWLGALLGS